MAEKRESFVFYESFYLAIKTLPENEQLLLYNAIIERALYGKYDKLSGVTGGMFSLILPQIEANEKRYYNGLKGGRPKNNYVKETETKPTVFKSESKNKPNDNENVNVNENQNDNVNDLSSVSGEPKAEKETKHKYGTFKNVLLSESELEKLKQKYPFNYIEKIENLSEGIELKGYKYKNHYLAVLKWAEKGDRKPEKSYATYDLEAYERMINAKD